MIKNKLIKAVLGCTMAAALMISVVACGNSGSSSSSDSSASAAGSSTAASNTTNAGETVNLKFLYIWPEYESTMTKTIKSFEDKNPNIKVQVDVTPWDQVVKVLQTRFASGEAPDVSFMWPDGVNQFVVNDQALELTPYMTDDWKGQFLSKDELEPGMVDDKLYAIPFKGQGTIVFYNKDLLNKAGTAFPEYAEDVPAAAEKVKAQGSTLLGLAAKPNGFMFGAWNDILNNASNTFIEKVSGDSAWKKARLWNDVMLQSNIKAKTMIKDYLDKGYISKSGLAMVREEMQTQFVNGKVAAIMANNNEYANIKTICKFKLGIAAVPNWKAIGKPVFRGGFDGFFASKASGHPKEAVELLKHLTSKDAQNLWAAETGCTGVVKDLSVADPVQAEIVNLFQFFLKTPNPDYTANNDQINLTATKYIYGTATPEQSAKEEYAAYKKAIADYDAAKK